MKFKIIKEVQLSGVSTLKGLQNATSRIVVLRTDFLRQRGEDIFAKNGTNVLSTNSGSDFRKTAAVVLKWEDSHSHVSDLNIVA